MTLDQVIKNIDQTIAGKERLLAHYSQFKDDALVITGNFIKINLQELQAIRVDLLKVKQNGV